MKYFTFELATGDSDLDWDEVIQSYNRSLESFGQASSVWQFARSISLNDAYIDRVIYNPDSKELKLLLLTGDLQVGYWRTEFVYSGARILNLPVLQLALTQRPTEIWYDEFTQENDRSSHSFLLAPKETRGAVAQEFSIEFDQFDYSQKPQKLRCLATPDDVSEWT